MTGNCGCFTFSVDFSYNGGANDALFYFYEIICSYML